MLREGYLAQMIMGRLPALSCIRVDMRGNRDLGPSQELLDDFKDVCAVLLEDPSMDPIDAHNKAFIMCDYEARFRALIKSRPDAQKQLREISKIASSTTIRTDLFLVCYEGFKKACHRRILLRICEEEFGAKVEVLGVEPKKDK